MLLSLVTVFVVTPVSAATVIKNTAPAIRANVNDTITLSNYSVVFDGDTAATSDITWKNGDTTVTTFKPTAKGVTKLTATSGSKSKDIYVVAKNASDSEYVLYEASLADYSVASLNPQAGPLPPKAEPPRIATARCSFPTAANMTLTRHTFLLGWVISAIIRFLPISSSNPLQKMIRPVGSP
jgi:hypothetical protein